MTLTKVFLDPCFCTNQWDFVSYSIIYIILIPYSSLFRKTSLSVTLSLFGNHEYSSNQRSFKASKSATTNQNKPPQTTGILSTTPVPLEERKKRKKPREKKKIIGRVNRPPHNNPRDNYEEGDTGVVFTRQVENEIRKALYKNP